MKALNEESGYEELIIYPAPINFVTTPLYLIALSQETMKKYSIIFQSIYFWFENFFLMIGFFIYLLILDPIIWFKLAM